MSHNDYIVLIKFIFNWKIIAPQYCVGFHKTLTQTSHRHICSFPLELPSNLPPHPTSLCCHRAPGLSSLCNRDNFHWLCFICGILCVSVLLSQFVPTTLFSTVSPSQCSISLSPLLPCKEPSVLSF